MAVGLERYGLKTNPFSKDPLDPLARATDHDLVVRSGVYEVLSEVDQAISVSLAANQPCFFLITGGDGTGRTSVANYILAEYSQRRSLQQLLIPRKTENNDSIEAVFKSWFKQLSYDIDDIEVPRLNLTPVATELREGIKQISDTFVTDVRNLAKRASKGLGSASFSYGVLLEDIKTIEIFKSAVDIFDEAQTVCAMSIPEHILPKDLEQKYQVYLKRLGYVTGKDVLEIIEKRWIGNRDVAGKGPFDPTGIEQGFSKQLPIGKAILFLNMILEDKLIHLSTGDCWPHAPELTFDAEQILRLVMLYEHRLRDVRY